MTIEVTGAAYCGKTADAITVIARTTLGNMLPMCHGKQACNNSKRHSDPIMWLDRRFGPDQAGEILARIEAYFEWVKQQDRDL